MRTALDPFSFVVTSVAEWMNSHQHHVINYLTEENRVLREQIGARLALPSPWARPGIFQVP
jgi:hypothetical protein